MQLRTLRCKKPRALTLAIAMHGHMHSTTIIKIYDIDMHHIHACLHMHGIWRSNDSRVEVACAWMDVVYTCMHADNKCYTPRCANQVDIMITDSYMHIGIVYIT